MESWYIFYVNHFSQQFLEYIQTSKWEIKEARHSALDENKQAAMGLLKLVSAGEGTTSGRVCVQLCSSLRKWRSS